MVTQYTKFLGTTSLPSKIWHNLCYKKLYAEKSPWPKPPYLQAPSPGMGMRSTWHWAPAWDTLIGICQGFIVQTACRVEDAICTYTHTHTHTHTSMREKAGKTIIKFSPFMERRLPLSHGALGSLSSTHVLWEACVSHWASGTFYSHSNPHRDSRCLLGALHNQKSLQAAAVETETQSEIYITDHSLPLRPLAMCPISQSGKCELLVWSCCGWPGTWIDSVIPGWTVDLPFYVKTEQPYKRGGKKG